MDLGRPVARHRIRRPGEEPDGEPVPDGAVDEVAPQQPAEPVAAEPAPSPR